MSCLFLPMCLTKPDRALRYAAIAATFSVLGGIFGWMIHPDVISGWLA